MRTFILAMAAIVGLVSLPAYADHHGHSHTVVSFGFGYGYPGYGSPWYPYGGFYRPYGYGPWYGYPTIGVGVGVTPHSDRTEAKSGGEQGALKMYVYPSAGQSESRMAEDRYQCHVWASGQSGYDPTLGTGKREDAGNYTRAFTACMEGRNYVVK
ncbi:MAG TPA: hypothetical protein VE907_02640 [Gammaproteobacteria bacterium]|nr:hypothetical protein [Gammaproteobacteria bacterium]